MDIWTLSMPDLGFRNLKVCNLSKFMRKLGISYSSVYGQVSKAKKAGKSRVVLTCEDYGRMEVSWTFNALGDFYASLEARAQVAS